MMSKKIIVFAVAAFVLSGLFPPWITTFNPPGGQTAQTPAGYHLIFDPPPATMENRFAGVQIDGTRLLIQWAIIGAILAGAVVLRRKG